MERQGVINSAVGAIIEGDLNKLKGIVDKIPDDNISEVLSGHNKTGRTPLITSILKGDVECAKYLLQVCHVDPMVKNERDIYYPLTLAAICSSLEIVELLIVSGAKLNLFDEESYCSPLKEACSRGNERIARFLINKGEDIDKSRCLIFAIRSTSNDFIKFLLECGADVNVKYGIPRAVPLRLGPVRVNLDYTPLDACCKKGNLEILKMLIDKGADHSVEPGILNPLKKAALEGHEHIVSFYLDKDYYKREDVIDCFELLGVQSVLRGDIPSAIQFWNKALKEQSQFENTPFESLFLGSYPKDSQPVSSYDHLIGDLENVAIHSMILLERINGIEHSLNTFFGELSRFIPIMNIDVWEGILELTLEKCRCVFCDTYSTLSEAFHSYIFKQDYKNIDSSALNLVIKMLNGILENSKCIREPPYFTARGISYASFSNCILLSLLCLFSIKENVSEFDDKWLRTYIANFLSLNKPFMRTLFHNMVTNFIFKNFDNRILYETFETMCMLANTISHLDDRCNTPLHLALEDNDKSFIDLLLKYGALTDTKNLSGDTIREMAKKCNRDDICIGPPSLQIIINSKVNQNSDNFELNPAILEHFIKFH